jgi:hypothetical protein
MPLVAAIAASGTGDNTVVAAVTGKKIRVTRYELSASAAVNAKWRSGTTDVTGLLYLAAAGATVDSGKSGEQNDFLFETAAGQALVLNLSGAVPVGGFVNHTLE